MDEHERIGRAHTHATVIEQVLAAYGIQARVRGGDIYTRRTIFRLDTPLGTRVRRVAATIGILTYVLGASHVQVRRRNGAIEIDVEWD